MQVRSRVEIDRARIERQIRELALEHAGGRLGDDTYLARLEALREQRDALVERTAAGLPGHRAVEWLRDARSKVGAATTAQLVWILATRLPEPEDTAQADE